MNITRPHFVVSDLHMGDKGPRDNFAAMSNGNREREFHDFLDYVDSQNGEVTIAGDLFELWQGNISKVMTCRMDLLDRLAAMDATYMLGNHDIDLKYFTDRRLKALHPLLENSIRHPNLEFERTIYANGSTILIIHGHEQDKYCRNETPDLGRISAIYSGMKEDKNKSPLLKDKWGSTTVEKRSLGRWDRFSAFCRRLMGEESLAMLIRQEVYQVYLDRHVDAVLHGHTHQPGQFWRHSSIVGQPIPLPIYNTGTWAEEVCTFARIGVGGAIELLNWVNGEAVPNKTRLELKVK